MSEQENQEAMYWIGFLVGTFTGLLSGYFILSAK